MSTFICTSIYRWGPATRNDPLAQAQNARLRVAIGLRLLALYRMKPRITTPTNMWQGLQGFPNYPGPERPQRVAAAD